MFSIGFRSQPDVPGLHLQPGEAGGVRGQESWQGPSGRTRTQVWIRLQTKQRSVQTQDPRGMQPADVRPVRLCHGLRSAR